MQSMSNRTYHDALAYKTLRDRFEYLKMHGKVGEETFGSRRYLNQLFYSSFEWRELRNRIIIRDQGCELAIPDFIIRGDRIVIHHIEPITIDDIIESRDIVYDPDNLICVSSKMHKALHYGEFLQKYEYSERRPNDTCPWRE